MSHLSRSTWLPQRAEPLPGIWGETPLVAAGSPSHLILVIDDSATVRKIMEMCHRRAGFAIQTFADGVEALRWLSVNQAIIPLLIYLDIEMPRMDGFDVARALRAKSAFASVPILMFSSRDKTLDRLKGRLAGARGYVTKPFREQEILAITRSYLPPAESVAVAE